MRDLVNTVASLILLLSLGACDSEQNSKPKSTPTGYSQINKLFGITEFSEAVIREKWLSCLQMLEKEGWAEASKWCSSFSNSLIYLAKGVMVQERNPRINALILEMSKRVMAITKKARNAKLRREPESDRNPVFEKDETDEKEIKNEKKTEKSDKKIQSKEKYEIKILSMTPKNATREYCKRVEKAKDEWLDKYFPSLKKRIYLPYGNNKNLKNSVNAILVDDSEPIRENYRGTAINPSTLWA